MYTTGQNVQSLSNWLRPRHLFSYTCTIKPSADILKVNVAYYTTANMVAD